MWYYSVNGLKLILIIYMYNRYMKIKPMNSYINISAIKRVEPIVEIRQQDTQLKPMSMPTAVGLNSIMTHNILRNIPTQEIMKLMNQTS